MRALSLHQPWASRIALGSKTIETRDWPWLPKKLIGQRLAIHAAKFPHWDDLPLGAIVCHTLVADVRRLTGHAFDRRAARCECAGKVGIVLTDVVRLDSPIPWKGHQGIFRVPDAHIPAFCERCLRPLTGWFVAENPELAPCSHCLRLCCDRCVVSVAGYYGVVCRTCKGETTEQCR